MKSVFAIKALGLSGGGAERVFVDIVNGLVTRGHDITVLSYDKAATEAFYPLDPRVEWIRLGLGRTDHPATFRETAVRVRYLRRSLVDLEADVAVGFMHSMFIPLGLAMIGTGIPMIASEHVVPAHYAKHPLEHALLYLTPWLSRHITVVSEHVRAQYPAVLRNRMMELPNPVSRMPVVRADAIGANRSRKILLSVGRLAEEKDHATLIDAFALIAGHLNDWDLRIVGDGERRDRLQARIAAAGLEGRVSLPGATRDIESEYARAQLFVLPSLYESHGLALAEALAHGLPAVGFASCSGVSRLIRQGVNGTLVIGSNRVPALAGALEGLMANTPVRASLVPPPMTPSEEHDPERILDRWENLIEESLRADPMLPSSRASTADAPGALDTSGDDRRARTRLIPDIGAWLGRGVLRTAMATVMTVACISLAFYAVDLGAVRKTLSGIEPRYAVLAFVLILCGTLVTLARFRVVLGEFGYVPAWRRLLGAFSVGLVGNQFVLNVIGQSIGRAGVLTSAGVPFGATIIATFVERFLAAAVLAAAGLVAAWFVLPRFGFDLAHGGAYLLSLAGAVALVSLAAIAVSYRHGTLSRVIADMGRGAGRLWPAVMLTVLAHGFMLGGYLAALLALGVGMPTLEVVCALVVVMFVAGLPISLGGWGVRELSAVAALGAVGIGPATALGTAFAVGVLSLGVTLCVAVPGLLLVSRFGSGRSVGAGMETAHPDSSRWNARLVVGSAVLIAVLVFFQVRFQAEGGQVTASAADLFALIGLGCLALLVADARDRLATLPRPLIGALLALSLLLACGLVLGYARFGANTWALFNRGLGWLIILGYVAAGLSLALVDAERSRRHVLRLFVTAGAVIAAFQIVLLIPFLFGVRFPAEAFTYKLTGYAVNLNAFGLQMTMTAVAAVVADRLGMLGRGRRWLAAVLVLTGLVIYFTGSRTGTGMFVMVLVLSVVTAPPEERRAVLATNLLVAVAVALAAVVLANLPLVANALGMDASGLRDIHVRTSVSDGQSDPDRWRTIVDGWQLWLERPIAGHGLGAHVESQLARSGQFDVIHSVPIWLMAEMGLIGLAVGLASFACLALGARRMMRDPAGRAWGAGLLMALACWGAACLLHDFAYQRSFWFFVGLAFGFLPAAGGTVAGGADSRGAGTGQGSARA